MAVELNKSHGLWDFFQKASELSIRWKTGTSYGSLVP